MQGNSYKYASSNIELMKKFKNLTYSEISQKTGISEVTLNRRLKTNRGWKLSEAESLANLFKLTVAELFFTRMIPNGNIPEYTKEA